MAKDYDFYVNAQPSIYKSVDRKLKVYFSEPDSGINKNTGILLLIPGFGANSNSNIYRKMRRDFSDKYNLVVLSCDYFGYEFMQNMPFFIEKNILEISVNNEFVNYNSSLIDNLMDELMKSPMENLTLSGRLKIHEKPEYCCDMGLMQAIDNITAVLSVISIIYDNDLKFNTKKILIYSNSHGSYLSYLCNAFAPELFSLIIDTAAYTYPKYIEKRQPWFIKYNDSIFRANDKYIEKSIKIQFDINYIISKLFYDLDILKLDVLYNQFNNKCKIISFHGTNDDLTPISEKRKFCSSIDNCKLNEVIEIGASKSDSSIFQNDHHDIGVNFISLFDKIMNEYNSTFKISEYLDLKNEYIYSTMKNEYKISYKDIFPRLIINSI